VAVVEDAAHAAGCEYRGVKVGSHGNAVAFSFYATKNMTTGEGGMITTDDDALAARMRLLSLHGMSRDAWKRYTEAGSWYYEVVDAGYKDNMTDIQASLGIHQLRRLDGFISRRQQMAARYGDSFASLPELTLPLRKPDRNHIYHLYPVQLRLDRLRIDRGGFIQEMQRRKIGTSVHFVPLHRHPFYTGLLGCRPENFPVAEQIYAGLVSLPLYPKMTDADIYDVVDAVSQVIRENRI
jgi:dTDP-4-amino-4,6-dideoxygalactose transaminase